MYYFLMHKNEIVALCNGFKIIKLFNDKRLPYGISNNDNIYMLDKWFASRKIPENRNNVSSIKNALDKLNIKFSDFPFLNYGLSLTDNYWFYPLKENFITIMSKIKFKKYEKELPKYENINYFENDFNDKLIQSIIYRTPVDKDMLITPDSTTGGTNQKYWVIRNGKRFLAKQNDVIYNYVAEKEIFASFVAYLINLCRETGKKKIIDVVDYQFEKGRTEYENVCFSELFTSTEYELVTYGQLISNTKKHKSGLGLLLDVKYDNFKDNVIINDYFDFLIILDFLTENKRSVNDIGFLYNSESMQIIKPAPVFGNADSFGYMKKDFTRANHELYSGNHKNVFFMNEEEQCKYIAKIDWLLPDLLYRECETFAKYLFSEDMYHFPRQYKENIINWLKYKIVMIANEKRLNIIRDAENGKTSETDDEVKYEGTDIISTTT